MNIIIRLIPAALALCATAACAPAHVSSKLAPELAVGLGGPGIGITVDAPKADAPPARKASFFARFAPRRGPAGVDESISLEGNVGVTVNEVVPIPGTDMIKQGQVQEGAYSQNNNRNATSEARNKTGVPPTDATILVKVSRP